MEQDVCGIFSSSRLISRPTVGVLGSHKTFFQYSIYSKAFGHLTLLLDEMMVVHVKYCATLETDWALANKLLFIKITYTNYYNKN